MAFFMVSGSPMPPFEIVWVFLPALLLALLPTPKLVRASSLAIVSALALIGAMAIWCCCEGWMCILFP